MRKLLSREERGFVAYISLVLGAIALVANVWVWADGPMHQLAVQMQLHSARPVTARVISVGTLSVSRDYGPYMPTVMVYPDFFGQLRTSNQRIMKPSAAVGKRESAVVTRNGAVWFRDDLTNYDSNRNDPMGSIPDMFGFWGGGALGLVALVLVWLAGYGLFGWSYGRWLRARGRTKPPPAPTANCDPSISLSYDSVY